MQLDLQEQILECMNEIETSSKESENTSDQATILTAQTPGRARRDLIARLREETDYDITPLRSNVYQASEQDSLTREGGEQPIDSTPDPYVHTEQRYSTNQKASVRVMEQHVQHPKLFENLDGADANNLNSTLIEAVTDYFEELGASRDIRTPPPQFDEAERQLLLQEPNRGYQRHLGRIFQASLVEQAYELSKAVLKSKDRDERSGKRDEVLASYDFEKVVPSQASPITPDEVATSYFEGSLSSVTP